MKKSRPSHYCAVENCKVNSVRNEGHSIFRFPKNKEQLLTWILNPKRLDLLEKNLDDIWKRTFICGKHFDETMFLNDLKNRLKTDAIPTIFYDISALEYKSTSISTPSHTFDISLPSTSRGITHEALVQKSFFSESMKDSDDALPKVQKKINILQDMLTFPTRENIPNVEETKMTPSSSDVSIQCEKILSAHSPRKDKLKKMLKRVNMQKLRLAKPAEKCEDVESIDNYKKLCTKYLPKELAEIVKYTLSKGKRNLYSAEYKQFAMNIYFLGPNVYKYLSKIFQLPHVRTLQRVTQNFQIKIGICDNIYAAIQFKTMQFKSTARECIICIDEMALKANLFYNIGSDEIVGSHNVNGSVQSNPAKYAMVLLAKGIHVNWKQPIGYVFCQSTCSGNNLRTMIYNSIRKLYEINLPVRAVISDCGSNFYKFTRDEKITPEKPYFFVDGNKIFYFFDTCHLVKSTRNNFFLHDLKLNELVIKKCYLEQFYKRDQELSIRLAPKLTKSHLNPSNFEKMKVKYAVQVLSNTISAGMNTYISFGVLSGAAIATVTFIEKMNKLFDMFNSSTASVLKYNKPFNGEDYQIEFLSEMNEMFNEIQVLDNQGKNVTNQVRSFKCWRVTISSLLSLWESLDRPKLYTRRLQQDALENFFGAIRQQCGNARNPTPIQFKRSFKKLFCVNYIAHIQGANCEEDLDIILNQVETRSPDNISNLFETTFAERHEIVINTSDYKTLPLPNQNSITYVSGYLLKKCLEKHTCHVCSQYISTAVISSSNIFCYFKSFDENVPFGKLIVPNDTFIGHVMKLENIFTDKFLELACRSQVGNHLKKCVNIIKFNHPCSSFPQDYFINLFVRLRIFYTLKFLNRDILSQKGKCTKLNIVKHL